LTTETRRYAPEIDERIRPHLKLAGASYRADETYIKAGKKGQVKRLDRGAAIGQARFVECLFGIAA
jgi:transposase-like protein